MGELLSLIAGYMLLFSILILILYILGGIGLAEINRKENEHGSWMAWLPIFNFYLIGKLGFSKAVGWITVILMFLCSNYSSTVNGKVVASGTVLPQPFNSIASYAFLIIVIASLYKIYSKLSDKAVIMTIFTILSFGLLAPIFLFAIRKNEVIA